jgi:hypothetical protein
MNAEIRRTRARNLQLLIEDRFGSQKRFAKQFKLRVSPTDVSLMCRDEKPISNYFAQSVEIDLALPAGWFDQKNWDFLYLPPTKHQLFEKLMRLELLHKNSRKVPRIWNRHCA